MIGDFTAAAAPPASAAEAGSVVALILAREDAGILEAAEAEPVANALDKLVSLGVAQMVTDKPRTYRLATAVSAPEAAPAAAEAVGDPAASAEETAASAA